MGSYPELCAKCNFYFCQLPIGNSNFGERDGVISCAPTNSPTPNGRSRQPLIFGFETIRSIGNRIQLFTTISLNFFRRSEKVGQLRSYVTNCWGKTYMTSSSSSRLSIVFYVPGIGGDPDHSIQAIHWTEIHPSLFKGGSRQGKINGGIELQSFFILFSKHHR